MKNPRCCSTPKCKHVVTEDRIPLHKGVDYWNVPIIKVKIVQRLTIYCVNCGTIIKEESNAKEER